MRQGDLFGPPRRSVRSCDLRSFAWQHASFLAQPAHGSDPSPRFRDSRRMGRIHGVFSPKDGICERQMRCFLETTSDLPPIRRLFWKRSVLRALQGRHSRERCRRTRPMRGPRTARPYRVPPRSGRCRHRARRPRRGSTRPRSDARARSDRDRSAPTRSGRCFSTKPSSWRTAFSGGSMPRSPSRGESSRSGTLTAGRLSSSTCEPTAPTGEPRRVGESSSYSFGTAAWLRWSARPLRIFRMRT